MSYFSLSLLLLLEKSPLFFSAMPRPLLSAVLNCTFKTLRRWFPKLRPAPSKSNLNQALKLNWIISWFVLYPTLLLLSLFSPFLIVWSGSFLKLYPALAVVAQWIECWSVNQRVAGLIPSLGHMPELQARSPVGGTWEATTHWCFSPSLSPSLPFYLKVNK